MDREHYAFFAMANLNAGFRWPKKWSQCVQINNVAIGGALKNLRQAAKSPSPTRSARNSKYVGSFMPVYTGYECRSQSLPSPASPVCERVLDALRPSS
jgi:hypothetical protein